MSSASTQSLGNLGLQASDFKVFLRSVTQSRGPLGKRHDWRLRACPVEAALRGT